MTTLSAATLRQHSYRELGLITLAVGLLIAIFALSPITLTPTGMGDDWSVMYDAAVRMRTGQQIYSFGDLQYGGHTYIYPPWVAAVIIPFSLLPIKLSWAVVCVASLIFPIFLLRRWKAGLLKAVLATLSPPMLYIFIHGQIDVLVLAGLLLPAQYWLLVAFAKPQVSIGLTLNIPPARWLQAAVIGVVVVLVTMLLYGPWPLQLLTAPRPYENELHNLWLNIWPQEVPIGVALLMLGIKRRDERFLIAAAPFLAPYSSLSGLIGPWLVLSTFLADWQAVVVMIAWWAVLLIR